MSNVIRFFDYAADRPRLPPKEPAVVIILPVVRIESYDQFMDDPPPKRRQRPPRWPRS